MATLKSLSPIEHGMHARKDVVNLYSLDETISYARGLKAKYDIIIIWNGLRYQIKHAAAETALVKEGWAIAARIKGTRS